MNDVTFSINIDPKGAENGINRASYAVEELGKRVEAESEKARKHTEAILKRTTEAVEKTVDEMSNGVSSAFDELEKNTVTQAGMMSEAVKQGFSGMQSARQQLRLLTNEIISLSMEYSTLSDVEKQSTYGRGLEMKIQELTEKASVLRDVMGDVNDTIKNDASDSRTFDGLLQGLDLAIGGMSTAQGIATSLGVSEANLAEVQTKLQTALAASNFLQQAQNTVQKQSSIMRMVQIVQTQAASKAQEMENLAKGKGIAATMGLTVAQRAFNLVAKANPYVLLATALLSVVGAVVALTVANKKNTAEEEKAVKIAQQRKEELQRMHEEWSSSVASSAARQIVSLKLMQDRWNKLGDDLKAKAKFIRENQSEFNGLGFSVNSVADAEKVLVNNTDAVVKAIMARAEATAYAGEAEKLIAKRIQEQNRKDRQTGDYRRVFKGGELIENINAIEDEFGIGLEQNIRKDYTYNISKRKYQLTDAGAQRLNKASEQVAADRQKDHQKILAQMKADEETFRKRIQESLAYQEKSEEAVGVPVNNPSPTSTSTNSARINQEEAVAEKIAELRKRNVQSMIDEDKDELTRRVAQIELDRKTELEELEKTHEMLMEKRGGRLTLEEEQVFAEARQHIYAKENRKLDALLRERLENQESAENEYLQTYGSNEQKRKAIIDSFNRQIAKTDSESMKKTLERQMQEAVSDLDLEQLKTSIDWEDLFSDIENHTVEFLKSLRTKLQSALDARDITEENAKVLSEKINEITELITSKGNIWESLLPNLGLRKQLERALKEARERGDVGKVSSLEDKLGQLGGWKDVFGWLNGSPLEVIDGLNANIQSMGDLVDTLGLGKSGVGQAIHDFAAGSASFTGALKSLAGGDAVGALNGVLKGFQSWGKVIGIGNGSNAKEVARVTERNTESNERLTHAVERLKETMDREHGASAVSTYEMALADQQRIIAQQMEILKAQMSYHGAHHSNAKNFDLGDEAYARISSLVGREVNNLDSLYDLTPEEMDDIRTKLTDVWASILSQGDYDKSEYWERYADLAGTVESLTKQISENLTQTSFESLRDDFVSTLMDMGSDASDFSGRFSEMMQRSLLNMAIGNTIDKELESWHASWAERLQSGTLTPAEIARYKSEYDALVARGLAQRDQIAQLTGYSGGSSDSEATRGTFKSMSQATGEALEGRFTAIQIQATRLAEIIQKQSEDVARIAATGNGTYTLVGEMNDVVWQCSQYLETIARNTGYMPSIDRNIAQMRLKIDKL